MLTSYLRPPKKELFIAHIHRTLELRQFSSALDRPFAWQQRTKVKVPEVTTQEFFPDFIVVLVRNVNQLHSIIL